VESIEARPVRGNIPTRLERLTEGRGHALVVAKAALDRLVSPEAEPGTRAMVRAALGHHRWMVLPVRDFPTAPAQGALALEVAADRADVRQLVGAISHDDTRRAVEAERASLAAHGGGCHEAMGATVLHRDYGIVTSVRGRTATGEQLQAWTLATNASLPPAASIAAIWPRPDERDGARRRSLPVALPTDDRGWWVARADAVPDTAVPGDRRLIWASGVRTWQRLAARGFWVHGCADGLGDGERPDIDALAGRTVGWHRLTHAGSRVADAVATYEVDTPLPDDLESRTHFYWTSGTVFLDALSRHPGIGTGWHGCGPGHTSRIVRDALADTSRLSIWLDYEQWHQHVRIP
jgi:hydroxymethylbilane synthase